MIMKSHESRVTNYGGHLPYCSRLGSSFLHVVSAAARFLRSTLNLEVRVLHGVR